MTYSSLLALLLLFLTLLAPASAAHADGWQAGVARVNITPQKPMWMSGYASRDRPADDTRHELWAKALVLEDASGRRGVLVTMDLVGISREIADSVCRRIEEDLAIPRSRVALATSHTHTGPIVAGNLMVMAPLDERQQELIRAYSADLQNNLVGVVQKALGALRAVELFAASDTATFAVNRRNNPEPKVRERRAAGALVGPVDHEVPVLIVRDSGGKLLAVVGGYACHATVLSDYQWSGDWPGAAQLEIEKRHPGTTAFYWAGCGGDQNPLPRRSAELMNEYGSQFADAVDRALGSEMKAIAPTLGAAYREVDLPFGELPTRAELTALASGADADARWAKIQLSALDRDGQLPTDYPYPIQVWRLGDQVTWVFLGGEVVVDYAHLLKQNLGPNTWVASYANDVMGYIPSRRVLAEGGYEGGGARIFYALPAVWDHRVEEVITSAVDEVAVDASESDSSP